MELSKKQIVNVCFAWALKKLKWGNYFGWDENIEKIIMTKIITEKNIRDKMNV